MAQVVSETQPELPPVQKYMQAMAVCNSLALLASQNAMLVFVQRLTLLKKLQTCWTKGSEVQIIVPDGFEPDLEGEVVGVDSANDEVDVKLEPELARVVSQRLPRTSLLENGESSDDTIVDEPLACSVVSCDDADVVKAEIETVEEEKPPVVKKTSSRVGLRTKMKAQEKEDTKAVPKRKRGRPVKPKKLAETKEPVEKRSRSEAKEEVVEDPESSTFNFLCIVCKEAFATFVQLKEHKAEAHGSTTSDKSSSATASRAVASEKKVPVRRRPSKPRGKSFPCSVCNKSYKYFYELRNHLMRHTGEKPFMCTNCGMQFASRHSLKSHTYVHSTDKPYNCKYCDAKFIQPYGLVCHVRSFHTGEKPYVCSVCGMQFVTSTYLKYHSYQHTGERPYACSECDRTFSRPSRLRQHKHLHSEQKKYKCDVCNKTFRLSCTLAVHKKIHLSVKPYSCSECSKTFTQVTNLKIHLRTHTGQKPYVCNDCGKAFAHQGTFKKHCEVHSK